MLQGRGLCGEPPGNILLTQRMAISSRSIGEVNTAGRYSLDAAGGHLSGMLAAAGGVSASGGDLVIVTGTRSGKSFRREVDIVKMSLSGSPADDIELFGGDTLFVNRAPLFYIYGQVQKPANSLGTRHDGDSGTRIGGGVTGKGTQRGIVRHRRDANGKVKEEGVSLDDDVQDKDVIYVKESLFLIQPQVASLMAAKSENQP